MMSKFNGSWKSNVEKRSFINKSMHVYAYRTDIVSYPLMRVGVLFISIVPLLFNLILL